MLSRTDFDDKAHAAVRPNLDAVSYGRVRSDESCPRERERERAGGSELGSDGERERVDLDFFIEK
jgi:hypothetical protein